MVDYQSLPSSNGKSRAGYLIRIQWGCIFASAFKGSWGLLSAKVIDIWNILWAIRDHKCDFPANEPFRLRFPVVFLHHCLRFASGLDMWPLQCHAVQALEHGPRRQGLGREHPEQEKGDQAGDGSGGHVCPLLAAHPGHPGHEVPEAVPQHPSVRHHPNHQPHPGVQQLLRQPHLVRLLIGTVPEGVQGGHHLHQALRSPRDPPQWLWDGTHEQCKGSCRYHGQH